MSHYIAGPTRGKTSFIIEFLKGKRIPQADTLKHLEQGKGVIAVIDNGIFEAALFCPDKQMLLLACDPEDPRPIEFLSMDRTIAEKLSGYKRPIRVEDESNRFEYKGYIAELSVDADSNTVHACTINIKDVIMGEGDTVKECKQSFIDCIEDYFNLCQERGIKPEKPQ